MSRLDKGRFDKARAELKADLELFHLLEAATAEVLPEHPALTAIALEALARSAIEYQDAGEQLGLVRRGPSTTLGTGPSREAPADDPDAMSTEELMRLVAADSEDTEPTK